MMVMPMGMMAGGMGGAMMGMPMGMMAGGMGGAMMGFDSSGMMNMQLQMQQQAMQMQQQQMQMYYQQQARAQENYMNGTRVIAGLQQEMTSVQMRLQQAVVSLQSGGYLGFSGGAAFNLGTQVGTPGVPGVPIGTPGTITNPGTSPVPSTR
jgi:hypothetical protein